MADIVMTEFMDETAVAERGIAVLPATGASDLSVAEWVIANAVMLLRGAYHATRDMIAGAWPRNRLMGRELSGRIGGAAVDVFQNEPLSAASGAVFAGCPHLILTPHIAGVALESNIRVSNLIAEKVLAHLGKTA